MTDTKKKQHDPKPADPQAEKETGDSRLRGNEKEGGGNEKEEAQKADSAHRAEEKVDGEIPAFAGMTREEELTNHLARCMADLQNYKRRSEEDKVRFVKFANAELLKTLLPALENLERSCKHLPEGLKEDAWSKGVLHTQADIVKALEKIGVKRIETVGKKFDLKFHEVLMAGPGEKDIITEELDAGYSLNGETFKAAKVKVGDGTPKS